MSVLRPKPPEDPIALQLGPLTEAASDHLARLCGVPRADVAATVGAKQLLDDYMHNRPASQLFQLLNMARRLREDVDAVAVVCREPLGHAVEGLFDSCCHPFHNALSRGERGGRPRLYFDVGPPDTDRTAGLHDLIEAARGDDLLNRWGIVWILASERDSAAVAATPAAEDEPRQVSREASSGHVMAAPPSSAATGWPTLFLATAAGPLADVFSPAVLTTASLAGIDVVRFLSGGNAMLQRFLEAPAERNPPLQLAAAMRAAAAMPMPGSLGLEAAPAWATTALCRWWRAVTSEGSAAAANIRLTCQLRVGEPRREMPPSTADLADCQDGLEAPAPPLAIELPRLDEHSVGQMLAMQLLALRILACQQDEA